MEYTGLQREEDGSNMPFTIDPTTGQKKELDITGGSSNSMQAPSTSTGTGNPTGYNIEDLYRSKAMAQRAGDKKYVKYYDDLINTEIDYAQTIKDSKAEELKDPFAAQKRTALDAIGVLEERYGRGSASNIGGEGDLSFANGGGRGERLSANRQSRRLSSAQKASTDNPDKALFGLVNKSAINQLIQNPKDLEDLNIYQKDLETVRGIFTQAFGSGTPQEAEAQALMDAAPGIGSSNEEAKAWFRDVRSFLGDTELPDTPPDLDSANTNQSISNASNLNSPTTLPDTSPNLKPEDNVNTEGKTVRGLGKNALNDLQDMVEGVTNLPKLVKQLYSELPQSPSLLGPGFQVFNTPTGKALIQGTVDEYKNLITHPLEQSYDHPVNTVLDVIPFLAGVKKLEVGKYLSKADDVARAGSEAELAGNVANKVDELPQLPPALNAVDETAQAAKTSGILPSQGEMAARTYSSAFIVPTKRAKSLKPIDTAAKMLDYGITGSLDEMSSVASSVTGSNGILSKVTRSAIGNLKGEVPLGNATQAAENVLKDVVELTPAEESKILRSIGGAEKEGRALLMQNPLDAFDTAKELEKVGYQYLNTNTHLTGNVKNIGIGNAYIAASEEIMLEIENLAAQQDILSEYKNPEVLNELDKISPKLADEFQQAKTLKDIRSLQAPFVRLNQMIELTDQAANSAFMSGKVGKVGAGVSGIVAGSLIGGPVGAVVGGITGMIAGPSVESAVGAIRPKIITGTARLIKGR